MSQITAYGINYSLPRATLLHATPLFVSEFGARTCYNSFDKSEHKEILTLEDELENYYIKNNDTLLALENNVNEKGSKLLYDLSHTYFHESTLEHVVLNFNIKNTSRGVLQELARHRIASFSVQSTRYTLSDLVNTFLVIMKYNLGSRGFINRMNQFKGLLVTDDIDYNSIEFGTIFNKLQYQYIVMGEEKFISLTIAKSLIEQFNNFEGNADDCFKLLSSKTKRNVGDVVKGTVIADTFSVDLMFSINLRSLKNFFDLRLSGAAYYQIQWLAYSIYKEIPETYLDLIVNDAKKNQFKNLESKIESGDWI